MQNPNSLYVQGGAGWFCTADSSGPYRVDKLANAVMVDVDILMSTGDEIFPDDVATVYAYDGSDNCTSITKTCPDGRIFKKTFTWTGVNMTASTGWIKQ